ncbi:MAG: LPS export ABC transporter periplasmic protein LptC [Abitibacteriaceae bacterium]|nr:LPS export ABC transporter periplasmic protein LptC [Abditibacteriaceae bacterium]
MASIQKYGDTRPQFGFKRRHQGRVSPYFLGAAGFVALAIICWPRWVRWLTQDSDAMTASLTNDPSLVGEGAQNIIMRDEKGQKTWEFSAKSISLSPDRQFYTATDVNHAILFRAGRPYLKLSARQVRLNQITQDLAAIGTVSATGPDGFSVRTEQASWQHQAERLDCPIKVHATLRGFTFDTPTLFYDMKKSQLHCPKQVEIQSARATMRGSNAVADAKTRQVAFQQGVQIDITLPPR